MLTKGSQKAKLYRVEAHRRIGSRTLWTETAYRDAPTAKGAAVQAGMPKEYRSYHRVHDGGAYEDPTADRNVERTVWIVMAEPERKVFVYR